jgi:uncharacterized protein HemY
LALSAGECDRAKSLLSAVVENRPDMASAWATLALIAAREGANERLRHCMERVDSLAGPDPAVRLPVAGIALSRGDLAFARRQAEAVLRAVPDNVPALEMILRLSLATGSPAEVEDAIRSLLAVNPRHPQANVALGRLQIARGDCDLAESSLRVALAGSDSPDAWNDLAWLLHMRGLDKEALQCADHALGASPAHAAILDTRAAIFLSQGRLDEAAGDIAEAERVRPAGPATLLNKARLAQQRGQWADAGRILNALTERREHLPSRLKQELDALRRLLPSGVPASP